MKMPTTKQVRKVMAENGANTVYTNKYGCELNVNRRVKCYFSERVYQVLVALVGVDGVTVTAGTGFHTWGPSGGKGLIVTARIA